MSVQRLICCLALLVTLMCVEAVPNRSKESTNDNESESMSHEVESKEATEESTETDSEYNDKDSKPEIVNNKSRDDFLRPLPLPETYGIPGIGNPDMIPLARILAESVKYVQQQLHSRKD